jgi:tetratricopeptide (TPR) repeat protein
MNQAKLDSTAEYRLGDSDELEAHVAALRLCTEQLGPSDPRTLTAANRLAVAFWLAGYTHEAFSVLDQALDFVASTLGSDHPMRVDLLSTLGEILFEQRHVQEAEAVQREVLDHRIRHSGPNHSASLEAKGDLAAMLYDLGKDEDADRFEQEAFEAARTHLGQAHPVTCVLAWNRAMSCERCGDLDSARSIIVDELLWLLGAETSCLEPNQQMIRTFLERRLNWANATAC